MRYCTASRSPHAYDHHKIILILLSLETSLNGSRIWFWHETWCGDSCLKDSFPDLFVLAMNKNALLASQISLLPKMRIEYLGC